ncbi:MAG: hypothetical protein JJLCMIEE_03594 [Acidimicrobiales bacterium]|nr:MAG: EAL domain-containing protein [Actinomycetota bacterium]MBV6510446.1 hypothetical protein [Acidimicrobiales bacterium]RIK03750.1 MAG: hypothetical protein DCC48_15585 [Acidobacteriota bacterium]
MRLTRHLGSEPEEVAHPAGPASQRRIDPALLMRYSTEGMIVVDANLEIIFRSDRFSSILGYRETDIIGSSVRDFVHPDDHPSMEQLFAELLPVPSGSAVYEARVRDSGGDWRWVQASVTNLLHDPQVGGVLISLRDVSDAKRVEQAVRDNEQRIRAVLMSSNDTTVLLDSDTTIKWITPNVTNFGYEPDELLGTRGLDLIHPDNLDEAFEELATVLGGEADNLPFTARLRHKDGSWVWVDILGGSLLDDPDVEAIALSIRDVSWRVEAAAALRESEERFRTMAVHSPLGISLQDVDGNCTFANHRWRQITGLSQDTISNEAWFDLIHPSDVHDVARVWGLTTGQGRPFASVFRLVRNGGEQRWVSARNAPLFDDAGAVIGHVGSLEDITDLVEAQQDSARLTAITEASPDLVMIQDIAGGILYLNPAARSFCGAVPGETASVELVPGELLQDALPRLHEGGSWSGEVTLTRADGNEVPFSALLVGSRGEDGDLQFVSTVLRDLSERKAIEARLEYDALHDPLTDLPNRRYLTRAVDKAIARTRKHASWLSVILIDIDNFRVINNSLGHRVGDELLRSMAKRLEKVIRPEDVLVRVSADEFAILCENLPTPDEAGNLAEAYRCSVSGHIELAETEVMVTASAGVAIDDGFQEDPEALIRDAIAASHEAKVRGRDRFEIFERSIRARAVDRLTTETELRWALDRSELRSYYQPIISLDTGEVRAVEALLRWEHPHKGFLLPSEFIGVAEETGLIVPMGRWVVHDACRQAAEWRAAGIGTPDLELSVNLSGRQLSHRNLVEDIGMALDETGLAAERLTLEITESVLLDDVKTSLHTLERLRALGVQIAIDDFGTGYSSLTYLRRFPVDTVKIDRSFVHGIRDDKSNAAIVKAVIGLAHALGLRSVAEGVEAPADLERLRLLGCDCAQGFLMARPESAEDTRELLATHPRW